ncbi:MAG: N-acetylmuramoyl-L-alanine amidase [Clostridia bacterium]|nr:N-acetylmuramoyl-L-alanine amidase [Clostridia bacterium]
MAEETEKGPLEGVCIVVDPGHGGYDGGARAGQSKTWEKEINLQMAMQFRNALEAAGARVILTREEDKAFADKKRPDLDARLNMAREADADMLLSVHMNQYHNARESGPQVFYRKAQQDSRLLAGCIQQAMIDDLQPQKARAALAGDYYMLSLDIPSVLVECGFISNPEEEKMLLDAGYQKRLAEAVCRGVCEFMVLCGVEQ